MNRIRFTLFAACGMSLAYDRPRTESFDRDPGWDDHNNRSKTTESRTVRQDFGYCRTNLAG